ncbi:MAG: homocysteine S-methyltransferase family protein [Candidatus Marinimicrobia bacterium]|nr:homocysteine S-methyltransferase family protein [Candidatus Neomarinimicrobiota bacterium]
MNLLKKISEQGLLFDGAMGTMLIREGLTGGKASDFWNLEKPNIIEKIHRAYIQAGSDIVTTNTFGGSRIKLKKAGLENHIEEINKNAVKIAKAATEGKKLIAGDIGPTGEMLYPMGMMSEEDAFDSFLEQATYLQESGVDAFIVETMFDLNECKAAIRAIRSLSDLPIFATLTFNYAGGNFATMMGNPAVDSLQEMLDVGANVVGANCSIGSDTMVLLAEILGRELKALRIMQPNAGLPETHGSSLVYPETPEQYSDNLMKIKNFGIEVLGGCCGTSPEYIARIRELLSQK